MPDLTLLVQWLTVVGDRDVEPRIIPGSPSTSTATAPSPTSA
jgi:hypothetical protein